MYRKRLICFLTALVLAVSLCASALALDAGTLKNGSRGEEVRKLQQALITLGYLKGTADGVFGNKTENAVRAFQKAKKLKVDGLAGKKTLKAIETADKNGTVRESAQASSNTASNTSSASTATATPTPVSIQEETKAAVVSTTGSSDSASSNKTAVAPDGSSLRLLHWFNDIKPTLKGGQHLLIYDPATGISWTLRVHSCGRHCDAEPLTAEDTANMLKAFGGKNTWDQKAVYVKLPSGVWTVGSTHDMPHMSGTISNNNFNGHLCVHFLRDMSEAKANDPSYGVANQETIRAKWKALTGETISN